MSSHQSTLNEDGTWSISNPHDVQGADTLSRPVTDAEAKWGITAEELDRRRRASAEATKPRERHCHECGNRVTETLAGFEAGHGDGRKQPLCSQYVDPSDQIDLNSITGLSDFE